MANIEHSSLTSSELHEPKGAATAAAGKVYVTDGAGSGSWKTIYTSGFEDFNHSGPAQALTAGVADKMLNNGGGSFTNVAYRLPTKNAIWNTSTSQFDWSGAGLALGDTVDIRFDFTVTTSGANDDISIQLDMAVGSGGPYTLSVDYTEWRLAGTYEYTAWYSVYMGDLNTLNYPAEVKLLAGTGSDTAQVNGWYVRTTPREPILV